MGETQLFILWENAQYKKDEIIEDIKNNFSIIRMYKVQWSSEKFSENLSRFYGTNLPDGSYKEQHCGNGPFILIIVKEKSVKYDKRTTSKGEKIVNTLMFDKKTLYREMTGGGHKVHATNNPIEVNHDITLLLDKSTKDFEIENQSVWDGKIIELNKDLFGAHGWNNTNDMFYALNNCINYAIIRNYEKLPEEIYMNDHNDIDLICESAIDCAYVLNARKVFPEDYRVHFVTNVENKKAFFDLRFIGDNYYCKLLEEDILEKRIFNPKGFYTISNDYYFYTLLYHAMLHKKSFSSDYKSRLLKMNSEEKINIKSSNNDWLSVLQKWLIKKEYYVPIPNDVTVLFNYENARNLSQLLYRDEEKIKLLKEKVDKLSIDKQNLDSKINELEFRLKEKEQEVDRLYHSRSWRATKLFRIISSIFYK